MLKEKKKLRIYLIALAVVLLVIIALIVWHGGRAEPEPLPAVTPRPTQQVVVRERPVEKIVEKLVEVEKEVSAEEIRGGLSDMGVLLTEEYYFTDVVRFSSIKKLFSIELGITESSYLASYDGVVTAGVDFTGVTVSRDEASGVVTVTLPAAQIMNVDVDPESFRLYSEKTGLGNPLSMEDFNASLVELEQSAREKALARGILTRADETARQIVKNFVSGLVDPARWTVRIETKSGKGGA